MASSWKVMLSCQGDTVVFEASATLSESRTSTWDGYQITHLPTALLSYRYTSSRKFGIQGKFVSRTPEEASVNANYLDLIRAWILPDFGGTGATPATCYLSAYGNGNIQNLPVIIETYSWTFPEDVDYIYTGNRPMPVVGMLNIDLQEIYSALEVTNQDWKMHFDGGTSLQINSTNILSTTPPFSSITAGIMAGATTGSTTGSSVSTNPNFGSLTGVTNSPQLSSSAPSLASNPYVSNATSNNILSFPTSPIASQVATPGDGFNRGSFTIDSFISE